jgi:hypothetical protein
VGLPRKKKEPKKKEPKFSARSLLALAAPPKNSPAIDQAECTGFNRGTTLRQYQLRCVKWMKHQEAGTGETSATALHPCWREFTLPLGNLKLYQHVGLKKVWTLRRYGEPQSARGGLLGDEMGLGKTLESIALMCANPRPAEVEAKAEAMPAPAAKSGKAGRAPRGAASETETAQAGGRGRPRRKSAKAVESEANAAAAEEEGAAGADMGMGGGSAAPRPKKRPAPTAAQRSAHSAPPAARIAQGSIVLARCGLTKDIGGTASSGELAWVASINVLRTHTEYSLVFRSGRKAVGRWAE